MMEGKGRKILTWIFISAFYFTGLSQDSYNKRKVTEYDIKKVLSQEQEFKNSDQIPEEYRITTMMALDRFPELDSVDIIFKEKNIRFTMVARPRFDFLFRSKEKRKYVVIFNSARNTKGVLPANIPFNAQIGLLGHEFSHILDYSDKSNFQILSLMLKYVFNMDYRKDIEYQTDQTAIERGLGWQLYDLSDYLLNKSGKSKEYRTYKKQNYMTPAEIEEHIHTHEHLN